VAVADDKEVWLINTTLAESTLLGELQ